MTVRNYNNTALPLALTIAATSSSGWVTLTTGSNSLFPAVPFTIAVERGTATEEFMLVTAKPTSTTFTVTRAYDGSNLNAHGIGSAVELSVGAIDYSEANAHHNDADGLAGGTGHTNLLNKTMIDAKGDLIVGSADNTAVRLAVGTDGMALVADSSQASGLKWSAPDDVVSFAREGTLAVTAGKGRLRWPYAVEVLGVAASVNTASAGSSILVDVNKNGTTIYSTQANRPSITAGAFASSETVPDASPRVFASGDYISVDIDQIGSTTAGSDLTVVIRYKKV